MSSNTNFVDFSKPFIDGLKSVFETMIFTKLETLKPSLKGNSTASGDVSAFINVQGTHKSGEESQGFQAMLVLSFSYKSYIAIANQMLSEENTEFNQSIADVGAEIANIVTGNAKRDLNALGFFATMSIPTTVTGPGHSINYPPNTNVVSIPIKCELGDFYMEICYSDLVIKK